MKRMARYARLWQPGVVFLPSHLRFRSRALHRFEKAHLFRVMPAPLTQKKRHRYIR